MLLFENCHITPAFQDQTGAAIAGDWISMRHYKKCLILVHEMRGADATATVYRVDKATSVAGADQATGITLNNFWQVKDVPSTTGDVGGTAAATVGATDTWVKGTAATSITSEVTQSVGEYYAIEIDGSELWSSTADYDCIQLQVVSSNAAHYISAWYILHEPKFAEDLTVSAIT